jgi:hypothetical protein
LLDAKWMPGAACDEAAAGEAHQHAVLLDRDVLAGHIRTKRRGCSLLVIPDARSDPESVFARQAETG